MQLVRDAIAVIILAGGEATRLPGKLYLDAGDVPMLARVYNNVSAGRTTFLSCKGPLPTPVDNMIDAPRVIDRWPLRGPLSGLLSTMNEMTAEYVFAVAGDAPFIDAAFIESLAAHLHSGDEAVVPRHAKSERLRIEPLAAIYHRAAFIREGLPILLSGDGALRMVIDRLRARFVPIEDERIFTNVNTPEEYAALREVLA